MANPNNNQNNNQGGGINKNQLISTGLNMASNLFDNAVKNVGTSNAQNSLEEAAYQGTTDNIFDFGANKRRFNALDRSIDNTSFYSDARTGDQLQSDIQHNMGKMQEMHQGLRPMSAGQMWASAGSKALQGAALGASIGSFFPGAGTLIGGAIGTAVGGAIGAFQKGKQRRIARSNVKAGNAYERMSAGMEQAANNLDEYTVQNMGYNSFAAGGFPEIPSLDQATSAAATEFNSGGTHETNSMGGIPIGKASDGKPNLVEEGEVRLNDSNYILSNRLKIDKKWAKQMGLPDKFIGKTFAQAYKMRTKDFKNTPNDPITKKGLAIEEKRFIEGQEGFKQEKEVRDKIDQMSPEEMAMLNQQMAQNIPGPEMIGTENQDPSTMSQQRGIPAEQADPAMMAEQGMMAEQAISPEQAMMAEQGMRAYGGYLFADGGHLNPGEDEYNYEDVAELMLTNKDTRRRLSHQEARVNNYLRNNVNNFSNPIIIDDESTIPEENRRKYELAKRYYLRERNKALEGIKSNQGDALTEYGRIKRLDASYPKTIKLLRGHDYSSKPNQPARHIQIPPQNQVDQDAFLSGNDNEDILSPGMQGEDRNALLSDRMYAYGGHVFDVGGGATSINNITLSDNAKIQAQAEAARQAIANSNAQKRAAERVSPDIIAINETLTERPNYYKEYLHRYYNRKKNLEDQIQAYSRQWIANTSWGKERLRNFQKMLSDINEKLNAITNHPSAQLEENRIATEKLFNVAAEPLNTDTTTTNPAPNADLEIPLMHNPVTPVDSTNANIATPIDSLSLPVDSTNTNVVTPTDTLSFPTDTVTAPRDSTRVTLPTDTTTIAGEALQGSNPGGPIDISQSKKIPVSPGNAPGRYSAVYPEEVIKEYNKQKAQTVKPKIPSGPEKYYIKGHDMAATKTDVRQDAVNNWNPENINVPGTTEYMTVNRFKQLTDPKSPMYNARFAKSAAAKKIGDWTDVNKVKTLLTDGYWGIAHESLNVVPQSSLSNSNLKDIIKNDLATPSIDEIGTELAGEKYKDTTADNGEGNNNVNGNNEETKAKQGNLGINWSIPIAGIGLQRAYRPADYTWANQIEDIPNSLRQASYTPLNNYLTPQYIDQQYIEAQNAGAEAANARALVHAGGAGPNMSASLLANSVNNQAARGQAKLAAQQANNIEDKTVAQHNLGIDQANAQMYQNNSQFNTGQYNQARVNTGLQANQMRLQQDMHREQNIDDSWGSLADVLQRDRSDRMKYNMILNNNNIYYDPLTGEYKYIDNNIGNTNNTTAQNNTQITSTTPSTNSSTTNAQNNNLVKKR